ncbi:hypothetical protein RhiJN_09700 [Ceratobasidium sp. AG-Ba]|nr:hypothetical protein RhiJN_09700 [Ceratobasidium sp. AG-Ba]QRW10442.1 hypothetical protein RhiLY_09441 [Ceratobasidium sp. AG-Ba]
MSLVTKTGSFIGSTNKLLAAANVVSASSMNHRFQEPHKIGYPDGWGTGPTEEWYKSQPTTRFTHLQYRKEYEKPFQHEYVVAELDNDTVCRFDRRGDVNTRANAFTLEGMGAEDTAHVIQKSEGHFSEIQDTSEMLARVHFSGGQDLRTILCICYGVQKDDRTRAYTLTKYNCYFLSWTIITATARRTVDWEFIGKDNDTWDELIRTTIDALKSKPSVLSRVKQGTTFLLPGRKNGAYAATDTRKVPFVGMSYLVGTLRKAIYSTRADMQKSLGELILKSTVKDFVQSISYESAQRAAALAARNHAAHAARDAAMEAVIEAMWGTILSSQDGGQQWQDQSKAAEIAVWKAASAAADSDSQVHEGESGAADWNEVWDSAWIENWDVQTSDVQSKTSGRKSASGQAAISTRAKEAWRKAWTDACQASIDCVPVLSEGVSDYVEKNLPNSSNMLGVEIMESKLHNMLGIGTEDPNSYLQDYVQRRIREHCLFVRNLGVFRDPGDIEEAMRRIWVHALMVMNAEVTQR